MSKDALEELRSIAAEIKLPSHVKEAVLTKAENSPQQTDHRHAFSQAITRRRFIYASGIAATAGVIFIGLRAFSGSFGKISEENSFVLKAYAEGMRENDSKPEENRTALMPIKTIGNWSSFSRGDDPSMWSISHTMDLSCTTVGVKQLSYSLRGECVRPNGEDITEEKIFFDLLANDPSENENAGKPSTEFSVTLSDKNAREKSSTTDTGSADRNDITRNLTVHFHDNGELQALSNQMNNLHIADSPESEVSEDLLRQREHLTNKMLLIAEKHFSEILAKTEIIIEATFTDESVQSKSYLVKPVQDFDRLCFAWLESFVDSSVALSVNRNDTAAQAKRDELYATPPQLYTVTELS